MARTYDCSNETHVLEGMRLARRAFGSGELVVIPTDTVYGVAADAFNPAAVERLLAAKGRGRSSPPPVLVANVETLDALAARVPDEARALVDALWPGALTIVVPANPSLAWDLGDARGTVALRMPSNTHARELLAETGPLAVSSANLTGHPAARTVTAARAMLGDSISIYLDGGEVGEGGPYEGASTIVDVTACARSPEGKARILRQGAVSAEQLAQILGDKLERSDS